MKIILNILSIILIVSCKVTSEAPTKRVEKKYSKEQKEIIINNKMIDRFNAAEYSQEYTFMEMQEIINAYIRGDIKSLDEEVVRKYMEKKYNY
jgi:predicted transcriptional regulator